jgi:hypothetical protein
MLLALGTWYLQRLNCTHSLDATESHENVVEINMSNIVTQKRRARSAKSMTGGGGMKRHWKVVLLTATVLSTVVSLLTSTMVLRDSDRILKGNAATVVSSQCEEDVTSKWIQTSLAKGYPQYRQLSDFLEGPALTDQENDFAICEFRYMRYWFHFPHT